MTNPRSPEELKQRWEEELERYGRIESVDDRKVIVWDSLEMTNEMVEERMQRTIKSMEPEAEERESGWASDRFNQLVNQWSRPFSGKHSVARAERAKAKARKKRR